MISFKKSPNCVIRGKTEMSGISPYFVVLRESHWLFFKGTNVPTVGSADHFIVLKILTLNWLKKRVKLDVSRQQAIFVHALDTTEETAIESLGIKETRSCIKRGLVLPSAGKNNLLCLLCLVLKEPNTGINSYTKRGRKCIM